MLQSVSALSFEMPLNACDAHLHIIDPAFPNDGKAAAQMGRVEPYQDLANQLHLSRAVFVQAKPFALDNACLLDAIQKYGPDHARGVAVVNNTVSDQELAQLHVGGVRGLRFSVWNPNNAVVQFADCLPLSQRIEDMGWNVQLHMSAAQLLEYSDTIQKLECKIVIDHMGRLDPRLGLQDPAWPFLQKLIDQGHTWVKLSGPYLNSTQGFPWPDAAQVAQAIAAFAPERVVWGSDFPHVTEKEKPSDFELVQLIAQWLPTQHARQLALVDNPAQLYGF